MPQLINATEKFKVIAVSDNTNSFGLKQVIMIAKSGTAYKACKTSQFCPKKGDEVSIPVNVLGLHKSYQFAADGWELPEKLPNAPKDLINETFKS
jgi:hypothetical protein